MLQFTWRFVKNLNPNYIIYEQLEEDAFKFKIKQTKYIKRNLIRSRKALDGTIININIFSFWSHIIKGMQSLYSISNLKIPVGKACFINPCMNTLCFRNRHIETSAGSKEDWPGGAGSFSQELRGKKKVHHIWKKGQMTQEMFKDVIRSCRKKIRGKISVRTESDRLWKDNKECFYK